ncbi:MAG: cytochrome c biogenesis protein CcsA [Bacteroidetes bacterium]|nr:cytochrome c biogenesis protein CcsA [Bacteroidota bacterium]
MIGNIFVLLALTLSIATIFFYNRSLHEKNILRKARYAYHGMTISIVCASAYLLILILTHQFQFKYVFEYSNQDLSTGLLVSSFFAGQEGSFLLWVLFSALIGLLLINYVEDDSEKEARVMIVYTMAVTFLIAMITPALKSPFQYLWSEGTFIDTKYIKSSYLGMASLKSFFIQDPNSNQSLISISKDLLATLKFNGIEFENFLVRGKGLNPLLQNFWMQIHPPILFVGFALTAVPYSLAVASCWANEYKEWIKESLPWVLASTLILGLGIIIGGYWAYGVLGWGGYWAWDPVENASLVPWIILLTLLHTILIQKQTLKYGGSGRYIKTNLVLAVAVYVLVVYSTFLTRSGILSEASVHSFASPGRGVYMFLIFYISSISLVGFGAIYLRRKRIPYSDQNSENMFSREQGLFYGSAVLMASALVVLFGTSAPIWGQSVEVDFYNDMNFPLVIGMCLLISLTLFLQWQSTNLRQLVNKIAFITISAIPLTLVLTYFLSLSGLLANLLLYSLLFTIIGNVQVMATSAKKGIILVGGHLTHIGFALFLFGVLTTGLLSKTQQAELTEGESKVVLGKKMTYEFNQLIDGGKKYEFNIEIEDGRIVNSARPVMYISDFNGSLMRNPDILNFWNEDLYVSPISFTEGDTSKEPTLKLRKGEEKDYYSMKVNFEGFDFPPDVMNKMMSGNDFQIAAKLKLVYEDTTSELMLVMKQVNGEKQYGEQYIENQKLTLRLVSLDVAGNIEVLAVKDDPKDSSITQHKGVLSIDFSIKPFISFLWLGVIVMSLGLGITTIRRKNEIKG